MNQGTGAGDGGALSVTQPGPSWNHTLQTVPPTRTGVDRGKARGQGQLWASGWLVLKQKLDPHPRLDGDPGQDRRSRGPGGWGPPRTELGGRGVGMGLVMDRNPVRQCFQFCFVGKAKRLREVRNLTEVEGKEAVGGALGVPLKSSMVVLKGVGHGEGRDRSRQRWGLMSW